VVALADVDHSRECVRYQHGLAHTNPDECDCHVLHLARLYEGALDVLGDLLERAEEDTRGHDCWLRSEANTVAADVFRRARVLVGKPPSSFRQRLL